MELKKGETIMMDASLHLPAAFLHEAFSDRSGVPPDHFELYYRGKRLEGEAALASWGIVKDSTIEVKTRGRGGAPEATYADEDALRAVGDGDGGGGYGDGGGGEGGSGDGDCDGDGDGGGSDGGGGKGDESEGDETLTSHASVGQSDVEPHAYVTQRHGFTAPLQGLRPPCALHPLRGSPQTPRLASREVP